MLIRRAAVAGAFYPGNKSTLTNMLEDMYSKASDCPKGDWIGAIAPHAGYIYSGQVAANTYACLDVPDTVIILSPNHTGLGEMAAVAPHDYWETPLGMVRVDTEIAKYLVENNEYLTFDEVAHLREHSAEVHVPFLQYKNPDVSIVPVTLKGMPFDVTEDIAGTLKRAWEEKGGKLLIIASSDMNHYESQSITNRKDRLALDRIMDLDPSGLFKVIFQHDVTMCGFIPATILLNMAIMLGANRAELASYMTSGDVSGDYSSVVGYAGVLIGR